MRTLLNAMMLAGLTLPAAAQTCITGPFMTMCSNGFSAMNFSMPAMPMMPMGGFSFFLPPIPMENGVFTFTQQNFGNGGGAVRWSGREVVNPDGSRSQHWESTTTMPDGTVRRNAEERIVFPDGRICRQVGVQVFCN